MSENVQVVTDLPAPKNFFARIPTKKVAIAAALVAAVAVVAVKVSSERTSEQETETTESASA